MLTNHTVAEAARAAGIPVPARFLDVTGSTNTDLFEMAQHGAPEWTVIVAGRQEAGRGRLGRRWVSTRAGDGLHVSLLLRPGIEPGDAPLLSLLTGVATVEGLIEACGVEARCKWPNDLVVNGRKLGGILAEASVDGGRLAFVVIGIGVNVGHRTEDFPDDLQGTATSVAIEGGLADAPGLLRSILANLRRRYEQDGSNLRTEVVPAYRVVCDTIGREVRAATTGGSAVEGRAAGIGDGGELLVETRDGLKAVGFGEVEYLR